MSPFLTKQLSAEEMFSVEEVKEGVSYFCASFREMVWEAQNALRHCEVQEIINIIKLPDPTFSGPEPEFFDQFRVAANILDLFGRFGNFWDHFNYNILERLLSPPIGRLCSDYRVYDQIRHRMKQYVVDMEKFRRHTSVDDYCKVAKPQKKEVPYGFKELIRDADLKTLQDVEDFRSTVAREYKLHDCVVFWKNLRLGSVIITLWIPNHAEYAAIPDAHHISKDPSEMGSSIYTVQNVASKAVKFVYKTLIDKPRRNVMKHFKTPLTAAAEHGTLEKVKELIARGEDVNPRTESTPLKEACNRGELEIGRALLEAGADPNMVTDNWTPLMEASRVGNREMIQLLVEFEAECNTTNSDNWTALMAASRNGHTQAVEELLQSKAEPNQQDHVGWSALLTAVFRHHEEISLKLAEAGANPHLQNLMCTSALRLAIDSEQDGVIDAFLERHPDVKAGLRGDPQLNSTDKYRETDLLFACKKKNHRVVKLLLCKGADPDCANIFGEYPLLRAVKDGNIEMVEELLRVGANPNMTTDEGTPLAVATKCGEIEIVKLLLKEKADPNKADFIDQLPLYHARRLQNEKLIELLEDKTNPALEHELPGRVAHYYSRLTKRTTSFFKTLGLSSEPSK
jgi:ankyrin repeat protein